MKKQREGNWANPSAVGYERNRPIVQVDRREWAMSEDCPEEELPWCWLYEFARESFLLYGMTREKFFRSYLSEKMAYELFELIRLFPDFPEKCWLKIGQTTRRERLAKMLCPIHARGGNRPLEWSEKTQTIKGQQNHKSGPRPSSKMLEGAYVLQASGGELRDNVVHEGKGKRVSYHVLRLDWSLSNDHLSHAFRALVAIIRQKDWAGGGFKAVEERTRKSERTELRALGAKRLLDRGMTAEEAAGYTQKELGRALYAEKVFYRKARQARKVVERVKPVGLGEPSVWKQMRKKQKNAVVRDLQN